MEMGTFKGPGVSEFADARSGLHGVADLHSDAALTRKMRVPGKVFQTNFRHHVVAAIVRRRLQDHGDKRRRIGRVVVDRDHSSIGDREDVLAEAVELLGRLAIAAVIESVAFDLAPIDGEGFGGLNAGSIDSDALVSVDIGLAANTLSDEPAIPANGGRMTMAGSPRLIATSGPIDLGAINRTAYPGGRIGARSV